MIDLSYLYQSVCNELGNGLSNTRLIASFPIACNRALNELAVSLDQPSWDTVIGNSGTLDFPDRYEYVLYSGIIFWLIRQGHSNADPKIVTIQYSDSRDRWEAGKASYAMDLDNIKQKDPTQDIIGWGHLDTLSCDS